MGKMEASALASPTPRARTNNEGNTTIRAYGYLPRELSRCVQILFVW
jgi:hypothetical protein